MNRRQGDNSQKNREWLKKHKGCSTSLIIRKTQIKKQQNILLRSSDRQKCPKSNNTKCSQVVMETPNISGGD